MIDRPSEWQFLHGREVSWVISFHTAVAQQNAPYPGRVQCRKYTMVQPQYPVDLRCPSPLLIIASVMKGCAAGVAAKLFIRAARQRGAAFPANSLHCVNASVDANLGVRRAREGLSSEKLPNRYCF